MRPAVATLLVASLAGRAAAQAPGATGASGASGATVRGVVHDSVARAPLPGAMVQLVAAADATRFVRTAVSDSLGRYVIGDVPDGRYTLGFLHPRLDSLGVEPPVREVRVEGARAVHADLAVPSPQRLRATICGADGGAVVTGAVRDARDGMPVAGATVAAEWLELSFGARGVARRTPRITATSAPNGWFALCGVPSVGALTLVASRGADSTGRVEAVVPADGFLWRGLYVAGAAGAAGEARAGRLGGTVVAAVGAGPLANAEVSVAGGPRTRTNARGEWVLAGVPAGTRMLDVRAVGYYPVRQPVDVVAGAPPVRVALATLRAVLDTVRVRARPFAALHRHEFAARRRGGAGRYLTPADFMRHRPLLASDVLRLLPGLRDAGPGTSGQRRYVMRGELGPCVPTVYVDGHYLGALEDFPIDTWMRPEDIAGIEIYTALTVPPQFRAYSMRPTPPTDTVNAAASPDSLARAGGYDEACGTIVFWTK